MLFYNPTGMKADYNKTDAKPTGYVPLHKRPRDTLAAARARAEVMSRQGRTSPLSRLSVESIQRDFEELAGKPAVQAPAPASVPEQSADGEDQRPGRLATSTAPQPTPEETILRRQPWTTLATRRRQQTDGPTFTTSSVVVEPILGAAVADKQQFKHTEREASEGTISPIRPVLHEITAKLQESIQQRDEYTGPTVIQVNPPLQTILAAPTAPDQSMLSVASIIVGSLVACVIVTSLVFLCWAGRLYKQRKAKKAEEEEKKKKEEAGGGGAGAQAATQPGHPAAASSAAHAHGMAGAGGAGTRGTRGGARGATGATGTPAPASSGGAGSPSMGGGGHS
ncbi:uncharacterized protein F4807DRAFT_471784 [Annulohypoxylon truncatum]|uniref:uncharacterized protein n=1 Tax=Annulohypoxylon truncatum TaxID=327061 RepID=UPI002007F4AA|nr:uncharacterized protein F4807DRAFT_471784 [Annulohypoxylon truncatum]KAI1204722.1 hypothetical protein F4807DRAFT_471784 [Annulohypoxylon truncatum]